MTSRIPQACVLLALFVTIVSGNAHLKYPNNPFFNQILNNVWQNQQDVINQNAFMQQQLQTMFANSQAALNNQLAANFNNFPGFHPGSQDIGPRPSEVYHHNPFFNYNNDGHIVTNVVTKPTDILPVENTTPMPIPIRPPYINPVDTSVTITNTKPDEQIILTETSITMDETTPIYIDGIPIIPLTKNEIRR